VSRHYLDHASTSPPRPSVIDAITEWYARSSADTGGFGAGDPARIHHEGMATRVEIESAREEIAACFGARSREVVFTSGATESIAAAIWGSADRGEHLVVPTVEHSAVRLSAALVAALGGHRVDDIGVDPFGRVDPIAVAERLDATTAAGERTALVSVQWANHEVGTVQPVAEVVAACRERGVLVHLDAAAAAGHVAIDFDDLGADLLSLSAHKFGGPPGIGALLIRRGLRVQPLLVGGDQERARRAGYENVPGIIGLAAACRELTPATIDAEATAARHFTGRLIEAARSMEGVAVYGHPEHRLPHLVCLGIDGVEPQPVLLGLDQAGIAAHSGSACSSEALEPSPVLEAMGADAHRSLRLSTGWTTTDADIDAVLRALPDVLTRLRALGGRPA
jgi:cysteine desulfurase